MTSPNLPAVVEDAATILERRDEFGHTHKAEAGALRAWASTAPLQRLHDLITSGDAPHWPGLPQVDLASTWYVILCEAIEQEHEGAKPAAAAEAGQPQAMADAAHKAVQAFVELVADNESYEIEEYRRLSKQHSEAVVFAINNLRDLAAR